ncbi:MAG TPA: NAD-dependent epimerase/dehydratase family protein [Thermoanaerobaculia bacterium]
MKLLVLGGTQFLGRHFVEAALARGDKVTIFHRGLTNPGLFPYQVERILGDRDGGLAALDGHRWDVVVDTTGYVPRLVRDSAERLAGSVGLYVLISTVSVYANLKIPGTTEESPLRQPPAGWEKTESVSVGHAGSYGWLKAVCEQTVEKTLPGRALVVRPGTIVGPYDLAARFPYWPWRLDRGGEVLAPVSPDLRVQIIDARDIAVWTLRMAEAGKTGVYNTVGPEQPLRLGEILEACREASGKDARFTWASEEFLLANGVVPFNELPLWIKSDGAPGFHAIDNRKAVSAGLTFRPLADIVRDTLAWLRQIGGEVPRAPWSQNAPPMRPEREAELLRRWHARS